TTVDRLEVILRQHSAECSRADLIGVLKSMEEIGCGVFIIGRRGQPSRFQWHFKMTEVGKAAQGAQDSVSLVDFEEEEEEEDENEDIVPPPGVIRHTFNLRPDYTLSFELPADFNQREASRLAEFVKTLPFEDD
ncbi:hypothetical protein MXD81_37020, partial [Microbacteriaceae bacterium K1510]|nr:hypothetical protein [Microbacteriaceae bacterium K1510]